MCGIAGITSKNPDLIGRMLKVMAHRGPDDNGAYTDNDVSVGHLRLAILDLSKRGHQPMIDENDETVLVFNGEIYNFRELRGDLLNKGYSFFSESDTEVLLKGYKEYGSDFFNRLRGMWAAAVYDKKNGKIVLSRDFFGIKPLYYAVHKGDLLFSSEMRGLVKALPTITPNSEYYYQFFNLGYFIPPATCFKEIKKLKPGEIIVWDLNKRELTHKFIEFIPKNISPDFSSSFEEAVQLMDEKLKDSVRAHFISDVPVGLLLSGGNDSSLLAALLVEIGKNPLLYNLDIAGSIDSKYAKKVAEHLGLKLEVIELKEKTFQNQYQEIWRLVDEPFSDISVIPTSLIFSMIKGMAKVVISGEGGDELFGGYMRHNQLARSRRMIEKDPFKNVFEKITTPLKFSLRFINPAINRLRNAFLDYAIDDVIGSYLKETKIIDFPISPKKIRKDLYGLYQNAQSAYGLPTGLFFDRSLYLPNNLMYKTDISSMASSIEARVPFLDKEVFRAVIEKINPEYCLSERYKNKILLKKVMEKYLPKELIYRPKKGFSFSFNKYGAGIFRRDLEEALHFHHKFAEDFGLKEEKLRSILKASNAEILINKYPRFAFALVSNWKIFDKNTNGRA